jgi:hypothetical protein
MTLRPSFALATLALILPVAVWAQVYWVPVVAHTPGVGDAEWRSEVGVLNSCSSVATVELRLHTEDGVESETCTVDGGAQQIFTNVVGWLVDGDVVAPLEIVSDQPLTVTSRTYTLAAEGIYGQGLDGVTPDDGIDAGETVQLQQLQESATFRSNLGVLNMSSAAAEVSVTLYDLNGLVVGSFTLELEASQLVQDNRPYLNRFGRSDIVGGYATVTVTSGSDVFAYASVVDASTDDPTTIAMQPAPAPKTKPERTELRRPPSLCSAACPGREGERSNVRTLER